MAIGLAALLDDIALIARTAASSVDDIGAAVGKTSAKAAGVVVDDAAVTPQFVGGVTPARELPIIWKITQGSLRNKLLIILPIALLLSWIAPWALTPLLMCGGTYLCFEGAEKILERLLGTHHDTPVAAQHTAETLEAHPQESALKEKSSSETKEENALVRGAITTDFILSAEIMVISLNEVAQLSFWMRAVVLIIVGILMTFVVYGAVGLLVKMDDAGLSLSKQKSPALQKLGIGLVKGMPIVLSVIAVIGTAAMLWVGGHIILVGLEELVWRWPYETVHHIEQAISDNGAVRWIINTFFSMLAGLIWGVIVVGIVTLFSRIKRTDAGKSTHAGTVTAREAHQ